MTTTLEAQPVRWNGYSFERYVPHHEMSCETACYSADLLLDGTKVAKIANSGQGGASLVSGPGARVHQDAVVDAPSGMTYRSFDFESPVSVDAILEGIAETGRELGVRARRVGIIVSPGGEEPLHDVIFAQAIDTYRVLVNGTSLEAISEAVLETMQEIGADAVYFAVQRVLYVGRIVEA